MSKWRWLVAATCVAAVVALVAGRGDAQYFNPFAFPVPPPGTPVGYIPAANDAGVSPWVSVNSLISNLDAGALAPGAAGQVMMTTDAGVSAYVTSGSDLAYSPSVNGQATVQKGVQTVKLMFSGDSITAGGSANEDDTTESWRGTAWQRLHGVRSGLRLLGDHLYGRYDNRGALSTAYPPGDPKLGDWHVAATGGYTLSQIDAEATTTEGIFGAADVYVLLGGENDIQAGIGLGHSNATIQAAIYSGWQTYTQHRIAANPNAYVFVCDLTPHGLGLASYAQSNTIQQLVNASAASTVNGWGYGPRVVPIACGSLLTSAHINSTGQHPSGIGYQILGNAIADAIIRYIGTGNNPPPRVLQGRLPANRLQFTANTNQASITDPANLITPTGTQSISIGIMLDPTTLGTGQNAVFWTGPDVVPSGSADTSGLWLFQGPCYTGGPNGCLQLYVGGIASYFANDALRLNQPTMVAATFDNVHHEASVYALRPGPDGRPVTTVVSQVNGVASMTWTTPTRVDVGALLGVNTVPGYRGDLWVALNYVATIDDIEGWYYDGRIPQSATAYYPLNDGTGTSLNPAPAMFNPQDGGAMPVGTESGASWSAAGNVWEPWNRYAEENPWNTLNTPPGWSYDAGAGAGQPGFGLTYAGGAGGAAIGANQTGGQGSGYSFTGGAGGASTGTAANANGGGFTVNTGAAGTGGSGAAGTPGAVSMSVNGTQVISHDLASTDFESFCAAPAQSGEIRGCNAATLVAARNVAGNGDLACLSTDSSNEVIVGSTTQVGAVLTKANGATLQNLGAGSTDYTAYGTTPGTNGRVRCTASDNCMDSPGALYIGEASATYTQTGNITTTSQSLLCSSTGCIQVSGGAITPLTFGAVGAGSPTDPFASAFFGANTTSGTGYVTFSATGGTHNSQDGIVWDSRFDVETSNSSYGPFNAQTYTIPAHHGVKLDEHAVCRIVTPGSGGSFWTAAADHTYQCHVVASAGYTGAAALTNNGSTLDCDCSGGLCTSFSAPTNPLVIPSATINTGTGVLTATVSIYNDGSTTKPVLDCISHVIITDD